VKETTTPTAISSHMHPHPPLTLIEKIIQQHIATPLDDNTTTTTTTGDPPAIKTGDYIYLRPWRCMTHDNTAAVLSKFHAWGCNEIHDPKQLIFTLDHNVQDDSEENLERYRKIEGFAKQHGIRFYPAGRGIGHQVRKRKEKGRACRLASSSSSSSSSCCRYDVPGDV